MPLFCRVLQSATVQTCYIYVFSQWLRFISGPVGVLQISEFHSSSPLGHFIHVSIITPVVSVLKNYCVWSFLEVPTDIFNHFWIQIAVSILKPPKCYITVIDSSRLCVTAFLQWKKCPFGYNGHVTAMAAGQRQRLYSGARIFTGNYLSSTPRALRMRGVELE